MVDLGLDRGETCKLLEIMLLCMDHVLIPDGLELIQAILISRPYSGSFSNLENIN